jgi:glycerol-3-phosphate cytidylyltransferase
MSKNKEIVGYTAGVFDMFHIGHLNILKRAKHECDYLIVGVNSDEATYGYKDKYPVIPINERMEIVRAIKYVDDVVRVDDVDKIYAYEKYHFDVIFVGDDHKHEPRWQEVDKYLRQRGSRVHYFSHTSHVSSSKLREVSNAISQE